MDLAARVARRFDESLAVQAATRDALNLMIAGAIELLTDCLLANGKILACGNGGSAAQASHFACALVDRFESERQELAAIALTADAPLLTAIANKHGAPQLFARQIRALGQPGDLLLALSTSGNSENVIEAVIAARAQGLRVIALTGEGGGRLAEALTEDDLLLSVPDTRTARVQEAHQLILHCLCDGIDAMLLGVDA
jgi:D-sedoheptulose 7-phosphate isomerase